ncbi:MAG: DUF429 domain-containing protein [Calditrichaeota bacterium]|nr:MAG: DUF429 domain-containing protein [Calditrichota bacterium]
MTSVPAITRILGVDFSGARFPASRIWIAEITGRPGEARLAACYSLAERLGQRADRDTCYRQLRGLLGGPPGTAAGLDFPFSLPASLVRASSWEAVLQWVARRFATPDAFRAYCRRQADQGEPKRDTDRLARVPMAPSNLRLYRQTYYGMARILAPLVREQAVAVLPFHPPDPNKPWLLEVCPASYLKQKGLYQPYKGRRSALADRRAQLLHQLFRQEGLLLPAPDLAEKIARQPGGDALDAVLAALCVYRALQADSLQPPLKGAAALEGWIYF